MYLRYRYRLYPTPEQERQFRLFAGGARFVWNLFLEWNMRYYEDQKKFLFYNDMAKLLTRVKKLDDYKWLGEVSAQVLQQKLRDLDQSLPNKKYPNRGFPRFKKKSLHRDSFRFPQHVKVKGDFIQFPVIGDVRFDNHRPVLPFKSATVILDGDKWYVSFVVDVPEATPLPAPILESRSVGIDLGISSFVTTSDGQVYDNPRFLDRSLKKIKKHQRRLDRKKKGSNNRKKQQKRVYNAHKKVRNQRADYLHQISNQITNDYDLICLEDLNVAGMMKNHCLARQIGQVGWSTLVNNIIYKAKLKGRYVVLIGRYQPSSKTCSSCGTVKAMPLSDRTYVCTCGLVMDRDVNAARNIHKWGREIHTEGHSGMRNSTSISHACGGSHVEEEIVLLPADPVKQENG